MNKKQVKTIKSEQKCNQQQMQQMKSVHFSDSENQSDQQLNLPQLSQKKSLSLASTLHSTYISACSNIKVLQTNLAYSLKHSQLSLFTKRQKLVFNKHGSITLLGNVYQEISQEKERFYVQFNKVIWLSYRSGIQGMGTDAGWGCMIRVSQMVLANVFTKLDPKVKPKQIIDYFKDSPDAYFSLSRICQLGNINQRWTSSIQIFSLLSRMLQPFPSQVRFPLLSISIHSSIIQYPSLASLPNQPLLIFISNRLGKDKIQVQYYGHFLQLMAVDCFVGAVGGEGGQALFLIGQYGGRVIFMDPHYVQQQEQDNTHTFFQQEPYLIDMDRLAPSVAFCFLVKTQQEHKKLLTQLYNLQNIYQNRACLTVICPQLEQSSFLRKQSDDIFQII